MCLIHNVMIRGVNTMLNQASSVNSPNDIKDFMEYAISFCVMIHEHHECEEVLFFPMMENATGVPGILDRNVVQHEEFLPKIHDFDVYCKQVRLQVRNYDAKKFVDLIGAFGTLLTRHLTDEIDSFKQLDQYNLDWDAIVKRLVEYAVAHAHKVRHHSVSEIKGTNDNEMD
jgi:hemerythrin-like domain-containing protein